MRLLVLLAFITAQVQLTSQDLSIADYSKEEMTITMRDGIKLHTVIYRPKNAKQDLPILLKRTPYSCQPYGKDKMPNEIMHNPDMVADGYIFVHQDVRGRWMSEGDFENTKPPYSFKDKSKTDEVTDTYDTIDWLVKNIKGTNRAVGMYGNSYVGWTPLVGAVSKHPNLKAVLAMAPVTNFYFEDFNRYGVFGLSYAPVLNVFGTPRKGPTSEPWYTVRTEEFMQGSQGELTTDYYDYFLEKGPLNNLGDLIDPGNTLWAEIKAHPDYDEFRQERNWLQYLRNIRCATLIVGGWNDEQNLYGIVNAYKEIEENNPGIDNRWVMGPWSHGHPKRREAQYYLGEIYYGEDLSEQYQIKVEKPYFDYHLKSASNPNLPEVHLFDTGVKRWKDLDVYPGKDQEQLVFYPLKKGGLDTIQSTSQATFEFLSDPAKPVPFIEELDFFVMAPKPYMCDDQRFTSKRPDVLTFQTAPLSEDITVLGEIEAYIEFSTDHEDADLYVKLVDVYPMDRAPEKTDVEGVKMNGYQQLVRMGYLRGRYRESFAKAIPFSANKKTTVRVELTDAFHTFKKGHRIMIQVQSSMFPLYDRNPQKYVESIYEAKEDDFEKAIHTVYGDTRFILPIID